MEDNAFEVRLCGDMVKDGNMPLDDYINYLSNLTKLCKSANDVLNPGTKLDFRIDGNIKKVLTKSAKKTCNYLICFI